MLTIKRNQFPRDFTFGVATSAYQIEGSHFGDCGESHWDVFARQPGKVANGEDGRIACDHYHRYPEDIKLIADLGVDAYRFSTSWARLMPEGSGPMNPKGVDFYARLLDELEQQGIEPHLTLYHWELPTALAEKGGWTNRDTAYRFADFADQVTRQFGDRIKSVATINEPWCVAWLSHYLGHHAPGLQSLSAAGRAMHHVPLAHGLAVQSMRASGQENLGIVLNMEYAQPANDSDEAHLAAQRHDGIYNRWFLESISQGRYPEDIAQGLSDVLPLGYAQDMSIISEPIDWLGINYYTRQLCALRSDGEYPAIEPVEGPREKTAMGWEIYPEGLTHFISRAHDAFDGNMPLYVTENGLASYDEHTEDEIIDEQRIRFLDQHLQASLDALEKGANLQGYFLWSLMDNYEWAFGYDKRFGIVHVDFETQTRTPKRSYQVMRDWLST